MLITSVCGVLSGFISLGFLADTIGRKPTAMLFYAMCLVLTPVVYLWARDIRVLLVCVGVFGFFSLGIWAWAPVWLPELFPARMRATAVAFCFNAPRFISCLGPLIAGTLNCRPRRLWPRGHLRRTVLHPGIGGRARSFRRPTESLSPRPCRRRCQSDRNRRGKQRNKLRANRSEKIHNQGKVAARGGNSRGVRRHVAFATGAAR